MLCDVCFHNKWQKCDLVDNVEQEKLLFQKFSIFTVKFYSYMDTGKELISH